jgi:hypothetical protein
MIISLLSSSACTFLEQVRTVRRVSLASLECGIYFYDRFWLMGDKMDFGVDALGIVINCPLPLCVIASYPRRQELWLVMLQNMVIAISEWPSLLKMALPQCSARLFCTLRKYIWVITFPVVVTFLHGAWGFNFESSRITGKRVKFLLCLINYALCHENR